MRECRGHPLGFGPVRDRLKKNIAVTIKAGGDTVDTKKGDIFKRDSDGGEYTVERVVNGMVVLESRDGKRQILTEIDTLQLESFYQQKWNIEAFKNMS